MSIENNRPATEMSVKNQIDQKNLEEYAATEGAKEGGHSVEPVTVVIPKETPEAREKKIAAVKKSFWSFLKGKERSLSETIKGDIRDITHFSVAELAEIGGSVRSGGKLEQYIQKYGLGEAGTQLAATANEKAKELAELKKQRVPEDATEKKALNEKMIGMQQEVNNAKLKFMGLMRQKAESSREAA